MADSEIDPSDKKSISPLPETSQQSKCDEKSADKSVAKDGSESPARCPICLATPQNDAKSDSCSHNFCFDCLKEWCKVKAECPLCKMTIHSIFYNIKSDSEYDEYKVVEPNRENKYSTMQFPLRGLRIDWLEPSMFRQAHFRRRPVNDLPTQTASDVSSIRRRRLYYWNKSKVLRVTTGDRRHLVRDCSAEFLRSNPALIHRLVPWLRRELTVLYGSRNKNLIDLLFKKIVDMLPYIDIDSRAFKIMLREYMLEYTDQFIHEFLSYARSPFTLTQYDAAADYGPAYREPQGTDHSMPSRNLRSHQYRTAGSSRWDGSPDSLPLGASAQSMMLSQTTWSEEPLQAPLLPGSQMRHSCPGLLFSRSISNPRNDDTYMNSNRFGFGFNLNPPVPIPAFYQPTDTSRDVDAPLQQQTIDLHRRGGSSARQYQSMERLRQHIGDYWRQSTVSNKRRRGFEYARWREAPPQKKPDVPVIVITSGSGSSEEENVAGTSSGIGGNTIHYKPASQTETNGSSNNNQVQVKEEATTRRSSSDCSHSSLSEPLDFDDQSSSSSGIEFVRYIKPPHLRTPDAFINLSSTDEDTPGPSSRVTAIVRPSTSATFSPSSSDNRSSRNARNEKRAKFFNEARHASQSSVDHNTGTEESVPSPIFIPTTTSHVHESVAGTLSQRDDRIEPPNPNEADKNGKDKDCNHDGGSSSNKNSTLKKIFEKGKVSVKFLAPRRPYSSSDSEIDVDVVEEVPISTTQSRSLSSTWSSDSQDTDTQQAGTLRSMVSIAECPGCAREQDGNVPQSHRDFSTGNRWMGGPSSNESHRRDRLRRRKRKRERHLGDTSIRSSEHKKHKKRHRSSRSSSVEFIKETS